MASSIISKHIYKSTEKQYYPTFVENSYVKPYSKIMDAFQIPAADVNVYGYPISGIVVAAGATIGTVRINESQNGSFYVYACGSARNDNSIVIRFIK